MAEGQLSEGQTAEGQSARGNCPATVSIRVLVVLFQYVYSIRIESFVSFKKRFCIVLRKNGWVKKLNFNKL
jgi:hypothetical protein